MRQSGGAILCKQFKIINACVLRPNHDFAQRTALLPLAHAVHSPLLCCLFSAPGVNASCSLDIDGGLFANVSADGVSPEWQPIAVLGLPAPMRRAPPRADFRGQWVTRAQHANPPAEVDSPSNTDLASDRTSGIDEDISSIGEDYGPAEDTDAPSSSGDHVGTRVCVMHATLFGTDATSRRADLSTDPLSPSDHSRGELCCGVRDGTNVRTNSLAWCR